MCVEVGWTVVALSLKYFAELPKSTREALGHTLGSPGDELGHLHAMHTALLLAGSGLNLTC